MNRLVGFCSKTKNSKLFWSFCHQESHLSQKLPTGFSPFQSFHQSFHSWKPQPTLLQRISNQRYINSNVYSLSLSRNFLKTVKIPKVKPLGSNSLRFFFNQAERYGQHYGWRSLFSSHGSMLWSLIGANVVAFFLWRTLDPTFMKENFVISMDNIRKGHLHTIITSSFSHISFDHLFSNMIGLYFFGGQIERLFGPRYLLNLYLAGAIAGSVFFLVHERLIKPSWKRFQTTSPSLWRSTGALGASGAVNAIILLNIFLFPKAVYYFNLIIPVPGALLGAILIGTDIYRAYQGDIHISGAGHLGGAFVAFLAWRRIKRPKY